MHTLGMLALAPVIAAEKSKVPFYVAGGALVLWALVVSLVLGMRNAEFPGNLGGQRLVSAITAVLVLAAAATAVITSGGEGKSEASAASSSSQPAAPAPETTTTATSTAATSTTAAPAAPAKKGKAKKKAAPPAAKPTTLTLEANSGGQLSYNTKALTAKAGAVTISLTNNSPVEHDVTVDQGSSKLGATPVFSGGSKSVTLQLKPGTYTFFCSVPGHRQAGMEGTLTVQ